MKKLNSYISEKLVIDDNVKKLEPVPIDKLMDILHVNWAPKFNMQSMEDIFKKWIEANNLNERTFYTDVKLFSFDENKKIIEKTIKDNNFKSYIKYDSKYVEPIQMDMVKDEKKYYYSDLHYDIFVDNNMLIFRYEIGSNDEESFWILFVA